MSKVIIMETTVKSIDHNDMFNIDFRNKFIEEFNTGEHKIIEETRYSIINTVNN